MPFSTRSLLLFGALVSSAVAAPYQKLERASESTQILQPPPLPSSGLPSPASLNLNLRVITIGLGTQNYTCNATTGTYGSNVAIADLYDATTYLSKHPDKVQSLPHDYLAQHEEDECAEEYEPHLKLIGEHYFADQVPLYPDFDLHKLGLFLEAKGEDRVPAPDTANDIDWVYLADAERSDGKTKGLKAVYRVETAGGKPPAMCSGTEQIFIPYAAEYWFYD